MNPTPTKCNCICHGNEDKYGLDHSSRNCPCHASPMKAKKKPVTRRVKKTGCWECPLCNVTYCANGEDNVSFCIWRHIFKRDEHYQKLNIQLPKNYLKK